MVIYKVTNIENGKIYIGKTSRELVKRKYAHYKSAKSGSETNFHRALIKYPKDVFQWDVIAYGEDDDELNKLEIQFIKEFDSYKVGYNMTEGGTGGLTYKKGTELYERTKHKLGKWKNGNPGATKEAIAKRLETFKITNWKTGETHGNYGHSRNIGKGVGEDNPMFGKVPTNARKIEVDGVVYDSIRAAATTLGVSTNTIHSRLKKLENYKYIN